MTVLTGGVATTSPMPASALRYMASSGVGTTLFRSLPDEGDLL